MAHYISGPYLYFDKKHLPKTITFAQFEAACESITTKLGQGYLCVPEKINEGGILFKKYPNKKNKFEYKSCRVYFMNYPFIKPGMNRDTEISIANSTLGKLNTFLKAFYGAPRFTMDELYIITNELANLYKSDNHVPRYKSDNGVPKVVFKRFKSDRSLEKLYYENEFSNLAYNIFNKELKKLKRKLAIMRIANNYITKRYLTSNSDEEYDDFVRKSEKMTELFPILPFSHNVDDLDKLDEQLINSKIAVIFYPLKCMCCCPEREGAVVIPIKRDKNITFRDFYTECEKHWKEPLCNHQYLEGFEILTDSQITPWFGS